MLSRTAIAAFLAGTHTSMFLKGKKDTGNEKKQEIINEAKGELVVNLLPMPFYSLCSALITKSPIGLLAGPIVMTPVLSHTLMYTFGKYKGIEEMEQKDSARFGAN